jgi:ABC-2 type transport system ATP-binding protein
MIRVDAVARRYGDVQALDGVTLSAAPGEVLGLLGPNGAGKTTLVRILATLLPPHEGTVQVGGHDVVTDPDAVRSLIGLAGQLAAVDELLTGRENLHLVATLYGLRGAERRWRVTEILDHVDLADVADRRVGTYSGGMRRRLDLAATLVGRPRVLLLDEPTVGLDPRSRAEVWRHVRALAAGGTTVILTSQHLDEVDHLADRVIVLDRGRVVAAGTPDQLKRDVGGDVLEARVARDDDLPAAREVLAAVGDGPAQVDEELRRVSVPTRSSIPALVASVGRLGDAGVELDDLGIRRPSLDDVFFALTGGSGDGTAPPTTAERLPAEPRPVLEVPHRRHGLTDALAVTTRALRRLVRTPQLLFFALVQPMLFLLTIAPVFGTLVEDQVGGDYIQYLLPGVLVMTVALAAGSTGVAFAEDLQAGIVDRFRSLPMARHAVVVGRTSADLLRNAAASALVLLAAIGTGYRPAGGPGRVIAALALVLLFGFALTWVFAAIGLAVRDVQAAQFLGFAPVLPLVFLSGSWIPVDAMAGGLQAFARNQPVNVAIEAARSLLDDTADPGTWALKSLLWSLAILATFVPLTVRAYARS